MRHVIIEGLDKTGKSTLAKFLSEKTGLPIKKFRNPSPTEDPAVEYIEFITMSSPHIIDRMHLSEMAYGPVLRGESCIDKRIQAVIERLLLKQNSIGIYCYSDIETLKNRFKEDNEDLIEPNQIVEIEENFKKALSTSEMQWIPYCIGDNMEAIYDKVR